MCCGSPAGAGKGESSLLSTSSFVVFDDKRRHPLLSIFITTKASLPLVRLTSLEGRETSIHKRSSFFTSENSSFGNY